MKNNFNKFIFKNNSKDYIESIVECINAKDYGYNAVYLVFAFSRTSLKHNDLIEYFKMNNIGFEIDDEILPYLYEQCGYIIRIRDIGIKQDHNQSSRINDFITHLTKMYGQEPHSFKRIATRVGSELDSWYNGKKSND